MIISDIECILKDGRRAVIRSPRYEDIPGLLEYLRISAAETDFLLRYPEECGKYTEEGEKLWIDQLNATENGAALVCIVDGRLAGNCEVRWSSSLKTKHRATIGIALLKEYWGLGIGTAFFRELIRIAEADPDILHMELEFIEGNARARALYEKMGFRITGMKPNAIRLKDGRLLNEYHMIREIRR